MGLLIYAAVALSPGEEPLRMATVYTGRASAILFLFIFLARPASQLFSGPGFKTLLRRRPALGYMLAGNHHVHMILLTIFLVGEGEGPATFFLNPGLYIYGLLIAMNLTGFEFVKCRLSKTAIDRIHVLGLYALAAAFAQILSLKLLSPDTRGIFYAVFTAILIAGFILRITAYFKTRKSV